MSAKAIGIDLGTVYSSVAIYEGNRVEVIEQAQDKRYAPSIVSYQNDQIIVGHAALNSATEFIDSTVTEVKRLIGRRLDDSNLGAGLAIDPQMLPYKIAIEDNEPLIVVKNGDQERQLRPVEVTAAILEQLVAKARTYGGFEGLTQAVITVPAYFGDAQLEATKEAAMMAGIDVKQLLKDPCAAALAYGFKTGTKDKKNILIYDFGGGTFDVSIIMTNRNELEVAAHRGDTQLGGTDIDNELVRQMAKLIKEKNGLDVFDDKDQANRLRRFRLKAKCQWAKEKLSTETEIDLTIDQVLTNGTFKTKITRTQLEQWCTALFGKTMKLIDEVLMEAKVDSRSMTAKDIDEVILIGGSTRIPKVLSLLKAKLPGVAVNSGLEPEESVAIGAAIQAAFLTSTATIEMRNLKDRTPHSLGAAVEKGRLRVVVEKGTVIPFRKEAPFYTGIGNVTSIKIPIYEGDKVYAKDNQLLGVLKLDNLVKAPAKTNAIICVFEMDMSGILKVRAIESGRASSDPNQNAVKFHRGYYCRSEIQQNIDKQAEIMRARRDELAIKEAHEGYGNYLALVLGMVPNEKKLLIENEYKWLKEHKQAQPRDIERRRQLIEQELLMMANK